MLVHSGSRQGALAESKVESWRIFDRIAPRYDLVNRLLSFRQDVRWRRVLCERVLGPERLRILDLATGTGDVLIALSTHGEELAWGIGLDMSHNMLRRAREKAVGTNVPRVGFIRSDAMNPAFRDESFDAVTMAFGVRNVPDVSTTLDEMLRVLAPGGRAFILEFSLPANRAFRAVYLFYLRHVLPVAGGVVSGDRDAYRYLNRTIEEFPYGEGFLELMSRAGFSELKYQPLSMGIATLYEGVRPR